MLQATEIGTSLKMTIAGLLECNGWKPNYRLCRNEGWKLTIVAVLNSVAVEEVIGPAPELLDRVREWNRIADYHAVLELAGLEVRWYERDGHPYLEIYP